MTAPVEVTLRLDSVRSLFAVPDPDYFSETATLVPGIDTLFDRLRARELDGGVRTTIELPAAEVAPGVEDRIGVAVGRYCRSRIAHLDDELRMLLREGIRSFVIGLVVLAVGLALSQITLRSDLPDSLRVFFGEGVFLVAAWVGWWYPLDTLIFTPRGHRRDRQVWQAIERMDVAVRAFES